MAVVDSPVGPLTLAAHEGRVCALSFGRTPEVASAAERWYPGQPLRTTRDPGGAVSALASYFGGRLTALDDLPVELHGTPFQRRVWERLRTVAPGSTATYAEVARAIGAPGGSTCRSMCRRSVVQAKASSKWSA